nr:MAG TPA: hypothetical protein [Caudoviricetes sp.]DAN57314.1 MAG TPA: hypothetical protein [Caudoviricetes sp.]
MSSVFSRKNKIFFCNALERLMYQCLRHLKKLNY